MSDNSQQQFPEELNRIYATLDSHDVEQFYAGYQLWHTRQRIAALQTQIDDLHRQIAENAERLELVHPPAVALATLIRLQEKDVNDIDLLDRMLECGEEWLDLTMQRLDYCEQLDFIHDNYTQWCEHALEGAYDWIDSLRNTYADTKLRPVVTSDVDEASAEATEELLLRKLSSEEEEASSLADTPKRSAVSLSPPVHITEETPSEPEQAGQADEEAPVLEAGQIAMETERPQEPHLQTLLQESEMILPVEADVEANSSLVSSEQADEHEYIEFAPALEVAAEAGQPQALEMAFPPIEADVEADLSLVSSEQASEHEYVEFAPPSEVLTSDALEAGQSQESLLDLQEPEMAFPVEADVEADSLQVIHTVPQEPETPPPVEAEAEIDSSPVPIEEVFLQEHADRLPIPEVPLPVEAISSDDASPAFAEEVMYVQREEPEVDATHNPTDVQVSIPEYGKLPAPAQAVKPQRQPGLWRRLFAIFRS